MNPPNNWNAIRAFYREFTPLILQAPANEWAADPYEWDTGIIFMTPIEAWFWSDIRACDAVLYPQYPVLNVFVDFANPKAKVAIECDGAAYHTDTAKDQERDQRLSAAGWSVYRIGGRLCRMDSDDETGAPSIPRLFMERICSRHGISRSGLSRIDQGPDLTPSIESVTRFWEWARAEREQRRHRP